MALTTQDRNPSLIADRPSLRLISFWDCDAVHLLRGIHREHESSENAGAVAELRRNHIAIGIDEDFAAVDVATQPATHAFTNQRQQARPCHDAATHDDALRREGYHQLRAQLTQVV